MRDGVTRDGLQLLGCAAAGEQGVTTVQAVLRASQVWGGPSALPGLRAALAAPFGLNAKPLLADPGQPVPTHLPIPPSLAAPSGLATAPARTGADLIELP